MRIDKVKINGFKNLNHFFIDLDKNKMHTVLLGQNASGKSNFLEGLVIIFRDLDLRENPLFEYEIEYSCKANDIRIIANPNTTNKYEFYVNGTLVSKAAFYRNRNDYLPKYV